MAKSQEEIPESLKHEIQEAFSIGGVKKLKDLIERKSNEWKKIHLNIAITGASGVGKSTFINAIRGVTADDKGSAHVDVVQATDKVTPYPHPKNSNLVLWDLPGVGTPTFPSKSYPKDVDLETYDFFLILSSSRFREDDLLLAKKIQGLQKKFHFVRTKMANEVKNDSQAHPNTHSEVEVIRKIRQDCKTQFKVHKITGASVFLIDSYSTKEFEFGLLQTTLIDEAPAHKKEAMIFSMSVLTDEVLIRKREALQKRIFKISLVSAVGGAIPIPGVGAVVDGVVLLKEVNFYKSQFGLDDEMMKEYAKRLHTEPELLKKRLGLIGVGLATSPTKLVQVVTPLLVQKALKNVLFVAIPIVGCFVSAGLSYGASVFTLRYFLSNLLEDAQKLNKEMLKHTLQ